MPLCQLIIYVIYCLTMYFSLYYFLSVAYPAGVNRKSFRHLQCDLQLLLPVPTGYLFPQLPVSNCRYMVPCSYFALRISLFIYSFKKPFRPRHLYNHNGIPTLKRKLNYNVKGKRDLCIKAKQIFYLSCECVLLR